MRKTIHLVIAVLLSIYLPTTAFPQTLSPPLLKAGWNRVYIENVGSIDLPPTMEIQGGLYKEGQDNVYTSRNIKVPQLVAQPKGLNDIFETKKSTGRYARVIIDTYLDEYGEYEQLNFNINEYKVSDIAELDVFFKQQIQQQATESSKLNLGQLKLIAWLPLRLESLNGMSCLHISYTRQMDNNPLVLVNIYKFYNNDRKHSLTMSYRLSESDYWQDDFSHILDSFRITNIRQIN